MSFRSIVQPPLAALITSPRTRQWRRKMRELKRCGLGRKPRATAFLRIDDPYSLLLAQVLADFAARFSVDIDVISVLELDPQMYPDRARLDLWARRDAFAVAELYGLWHPDADAESLGQGSFSPSACRDAASALSEAAAIGLEEVAELFRQFWSGNPVQPKDPAKAAKLEEQTANALARRGHYMSAMIEYEGEWYWGIDRLNHLEQRLIDAGLSSESQPTFTRRFEAWAEAAQLAGGAEQRTLTIFWSGRSPYSYLALARVKSLAEHYGLGLEIRPVLPMVMRDLAVPRTKRFYILLDAKREADWLGIPLGRVCDPVGRGIERCYSVMEWARTLEPARDFDWAVSFAHNVWSQGVDAATDRGIRSIAEHAGIDPSEAVAAANSADSEVWRQRVEANRTAMLDAGFWGVPTICYGDQAVWGQDRFWLVERAIRADLERAQ